MTLQEQIDALRAAVGKVTCARCGKPTPWELWPIDVDCPDCPDCADVRALLNPSEAEHPPSPPIVRITAELLGDAAVLQAVIAKEMERGPFVLALLNLE